MLQTTVKLNSLVSFLTQSETFENLKVRTQGVSIRWLERKTALVWSVDGATGDIASHGGNNIRGSRGYHEFL